MLPVCSVRFEKKRITNESEHLTQTKTLAGKQRHLLCAGILTTYIALHKVYDHTNENETCNCRSWFLKIQRP